ERLLQYLQAHAAELDADSQRRLAGNPLRVLDSKHPQMQEVIRGAPLLTEHLDPESHAHFEALCSMLRAVGVSYEINPRLVRSLARRRWSSSSACAASGRECVSSSTWAPATSRRSSAARTRAARRWR